SSDWLCGWPVRGGGWRSRSESEAGGLPAAPRDIPIGTAYAVWTGIGATGTFIVGILFHGDPASAGRLVSVGLIVAGIVGLKLAHGAG
ncbi:MAG: SMR family transporter, partial [Candidatus Competibacter phosphatis]